MSEKTPKRPRTNVERVVEFMEWGSPLRQAFVMEAIRRYAKECVEQRDTLGKAMEGGFVSPEAWIAIAASWLEENPEYK